MAHAQYVESNIDQEILQFFKNVEVNCEWTKSENFFLGKCNIP